MSYPAKVADICKALKLPDSRQPALYLILKALQDQGVNGIAPITAALCTVFVECQFQSIEEHGGPGYFKRYDFRKDLGDNAVGDGLKYHGRGFCQLTGKANYIEYGHALGLDLERHPELALDAETSAKIFALFFKKHGMDIWATRGHWQKVRKIFNGGLNGWNDFESHVYTLLDLFYAK